ncbi:MAG: DUF2520 domain-containing protein [Hydrogenophaga sp.]|nr:DUF2520 domain-containing protein [Hydrogenophaga sp.]
MIHLNVIGCGRVGTTLATLLQRAGVCQVQDLFSRTFDTAQAAAQFVGAGTAVAHMADMRPAEVWMLSVPDTQVAAAAGELSRSAGLFPPSNGRAPTVFHCSGFLPATALGALQALGWQAASAHPVMNFANPAQCVSQFRGTPCGLEGDEQAVTLLRELLSAIGGECFSVPTESKPLYHAAAVFSSNFMAVLQAIAQEGWAAAGVPAALMPRIHGALLRGSVDNLLTLGPPKAITGPAARGDTAVVAAQAAQVSQWHPEAGEIYRAMSVLARRLATTGSTQSLFDAGLSPEHEAGPTPRIGP